MRVRSKVLVTSVGTWATWDIRDAQKWEGRSGGSEAANNLCASCGEKGHIAVACRKNAKEDECIGELATVETSSFKEKEEDQAGTEVCKSLLKQNDATQGSSSSNGASVLVQV
ncbi:hypothetical protein LguiB_033310 [Lonicera macranthoides]